MEKLYIIRQRIIYKSYFYREISQRFKGSLEVGKMDGYWIFFGLLATALVVWIFIDSMGGVENA